VNSLTKILPSLLIFSFMSGYLVAQTNGNEEPRDAPTMLQTIQTDIRELRFLNEKIGVADEMDHDYLVFRQDERSFQVLADFDALVVEAVNLPEDSQQRQEIEQQLIEYGAGAGSAMFDRINKIKQRIVNYTAALSDLNGGSLVSTQAYIQNLEAIRIRYYEAMVNHMDSRKALGLPAEELLEQLKPELYLYAETLAGRIEFAGSSRTKVQNRLAKDPDNTDISAALADLDTDHGINASRLEAMIMLLDSLELDSSDYKTVMLEQSDSLSLSFFSPAALFSVLQDGWRAVKAKSAENAPDFLFRLLLFIAVLLIFRTLSRITRRVVRAASERSSLDMSELLKNILVSTSGGTVMAVGALMALSQVGISLAPMLAGLGVAGFIVGFALQDTLGNFAAGSMILIYRPFDVDDFVEVTGASGLVKKMNLVSTTIVTFDNQTLVVPNSKIWGDVIKNVTAQKERRVDLEFGIGYDDDIELAESVLIEIVSAHEKILKQPEPMIHLHTLGDSSVNFIVRPWTKTENYWGVYWDLMREVKLRFDREGISIPYPQRDVHLYTEKKDKKED